MTGTQKWLSVNMAFQIDGLKIPRKWDVGTSLA